MRVRVALFGLALVSAAGAQPTPAPAPAPAPTPAPAPAPRVAVFSVHVAPGIDPSLSALVERQLGQSAGRLGYELTDPTTTSRVATGLSGALTPERASGLVQQSGSAFGLFASVSASGGRYLVNVQVSPASGPPRSAAAAGVSSDLYASIDQALRSLLPPAQSSAAASPAPAPAVAPESEPFPEGRFRLALGGAAAFGVSPGPFQNYLAGARADWRFSDEASLGIGVQYANLKGKEGRAHNVLSVALFEYRIDVGAGWAVPLRFGSGYLPKNGPVVKTAAGVSAPLGDDLELTAELLAPTIWITNERAVLSLDVSAEIGVTF
ncbi:MAG: hypothetical protein HS104_11030 [Polyangiaceae bacterium]|nr:hypothetical protein [Polyangiaceae bacterium]